MTLDSGSQIVSRHFSKMRATGKILGKTFGNLKPELKALRDYLVRAPLSKIAPKENNNNVGMIVRAVYQALS